MANGLLRDNGNGYQASVKNILAAKKFFDEHPEGRIPTGMWSNSVWGKAEFYAWFRSCLDAKTGAKPYTPRQLDKIHDARIINEYFGKRIIRRGCNILRDPAYARRYPQINNSFLEN